MTDTTISLIRNGGKYVELLPAIIGTIYFYKYRNTSLKFPYLYSNILHLRIHRILCKEKQCICFFDENGIDYNHWMYNILYFVIADEFNFYVRFYMER